LCRKGICDPRESMAVRPGGRLLAVRRDSETTVKKQQDRTVRQDRANSPQEKAAYARSRAAKSSPKAQVRQADDADLDQRSTHAQRVRHLYRELGDAMNDAAFVIGPEGKFLEVNRTAVETYGFSHAEFLTMGPEDIDVGRTPEMIERSIAEIASTGRKVFESLHRTQGGRIFPVEISSSPVSYKGRPALISLVRDVTQQRRAELMMEARLRLLELATSSTVEELLRATLDELERLTESHIGFCNFLDADEDVVTAAAWSTRTLAEYCRAERHNLHLRVSQAGVWADCIRERRPVIHNDYAALPHRKGTPPGHGALFRELAVPVFRDEKIVAVVAVGNKPGEYTALDVDTVSSFADLAWDIAARKKAEIALQESDARNRRLLDASPDAVLLSDPTGHFLDCNQTAIDRYGYSRDEFLLMSYRDLAALDLRDRAGEHVQETMERGETVFEWRHRCKDGSELPVEIRTVFFTAQGEPRIMATVRDLTEPKRAEAELHQSEERFKSLSSMTTEGIMIHEDGVIVDANQAFANIIGCCDVDELVGKTGLEVLPATPRSREDILVHMRSNSTETYEIELERPDGSTLWAETRGSEIMHRGRGARLVYLRDITEAKQAQAEQERLQAQLRQAAKMESVGRLAGGVAHDFNNMLAVILGHVELALERVDPQQPIYADLREIRRAANRSAGITQQLLAFARKQVAVPDVIDLNEAVQGMLDMLRRLIGEHIQLVWRPSTELGRVEIDPSQLDQILVNLCLNSRDAIAEAGKITIETADVMLDDPFCQQHDGCIPGRYVLLSVSDTGRGIEPDMLEHLFEPFFTTKSPGEGTGLGLAMIYGIVKQNKGFIDISSKPGHGTIVRIYLPFAKDAPLDRDTSEQPGDIALGGGETILVVEDEVSVLRLTERVLGAMNYKVLAAQTPTEAMLIAEAYPGDIALLVTDVIMPEMDGRELSERLLELRTQLKTLFVSGYATDVISGKGVLDNGICFLEKPFTPQALAAQVRKALDRQ
jgi:two-component system cell cycle sensor histidine kinase/response regulator CckA